MTICINGLLKSRKGTKSESKSELIAMLGAHKWAEILHNPCILGDRSPVFLGGRHRETDNRGRGMVLGYLGMSVEARPTMTR